MTGVAVEPGLDALISEAWQTYRRAEENGLAALVRPSIPILFFGDYRAYGTSPRRIVTVGLNPSRHEFPADDRFERFPAARWANASVPEPDQFVSALADYFRVAPYNAWFKPAYEEVLQGMDASYYDGASNTALHTDICSPLATDPTWSKLGAEQSLLTNEGIDLWHRLVEWLVPDVILISVARRHLEKIRFVQCGTWRTLHTVERENPFRVEAVELEIVPGRRTLLVFGQAANLPLGTVAFEDKRRIGAAIAEEFGG